jgi:murein DD-endopeptidase MepM/ murein hydrolase activator NlpD
MQPVPGRGVSTPYGKRGSYWSCRKNSSGQGIHTGADFAAPQGTQIVAPIAGTIRHRYYGSAFGKHQFAISPSKGQPFASGEVFFAHTTTRLADGTEVKAGQKIAKIGSEGNATGPHLHMEFMPKTKGKWTCDVQANPQPVIDWEEEEEDMALSDEDIERIAKRVNETLGDYDAKGKVQDAADNPPKTASTRLRQIAKSLDG